MELAVEKEILSENPRDLLSEHRGHYLMVNAISRRVRQLQQGERFLALPPDGSREYVRIAAQEFFEEKLKVVARGHDYKFTEEPPTGEAQDDVEAEDFEAEAQ